MHHQEHAHGQCRDDAPPPLPNANQLLAGLAPEERERLFVFARPVELDAGDEVAAAGVDVQYVYFPVDAIVSVLGTTDNGGSAEIALVGSEGMTGISVFMGAADMTHAVVQTPGMALRMAASNLREAFNRAPSVRQLLLRYMQVMLSQASQNVVCNRHHTVEQQLCRRLLAVLDRSHSNELNMTQESIANLLGVRRAGINEAANRLQKLGLVRYSRGRIIVLDRPGLERRTCECYATIRNEFDRLFPPRVSATGRPRVVDAHAGLAHPAPHAT